MPPPRRDQAGGRRPPRKSGRPGPRFKPRPRPVEPRPETSATGEPERLQKVLAQAGLGSRRACEEFILQGRVTIDGQVVRELGTKVDPAKHRIAVDGQTIHAERMVYFAVNKPRGYV
jgi:23S rRNA pseudouridine2605 synthase